MKEFIKYCICGALFGAAVAVGLLFFGRVALYVACVAVWLVSWIVLYHDYKGGLIREFWNMLTK